jgi:hypothetical protein
MRQGLSPWLALPIVAVVYGDLHIQTSVAKTLGSVAFGVAAGFLLIDTGSLLSPLTLRLLVAGALSSQTDGHEPRNSPSRVATFQAMSRLWCNHSPFRSSQGGGYPSLP